MKGFKTIRNLIVIAGVLAGTGYLRMPYEQEFTEDLRERKIAQPAIQAETWSEMGQTSLAGVFGGLRSMMAMMVSLGAFDHFENNEWYDLKKDYEVITALDPYNPFYWETGGWHLGWNAASWAKRNEDFSPRKRRVMEMDYIETADAFYREGLKYNPDAKRLWFEMGSMWSNEYKRPDLEKAAEAFKMARDSGNPVFRRRYLFTIARIPGRELEAYEEMMRLLRENPQAHLQTSTFRSLLVVLGTIPNLPENALRPTIDQVFRTKDKAYQDLYNYRKRVLEVGFYAGDLDRILKELIVELDVPDLWNPFVTVNTARIHFEDWRERYKQKRE